MAKKKKIAIKYGNIELNNDDLTDIVFCIFGMLLEKNKIKIEADPKFNAENFKEFVKKRNKSK